MNPKILAQHLRKPEGKYGIEVSEFMFKGNASFYTNLKQFINFDLPLNIAEIGMGGGKHISALLSDKVNYFAIDYSFTMIQEAEKNCKNLNNIQFICCDANKIPLQNNSLDILFAINTIYFWENLNNYFKEFYRLLNEGGQLILGKRTYEDIITLNEFTQFGFINYSIDFILNVGINEGFQLKNHTIFKENETKVKGITYTLHNEFIHLIK